MEFNLGALPHGAQDLLLSSFLQTFPDAFTLGTGTQGVASCRTFHCRGRAQKGQFFTHTNHTGLLTPLLVSLGWGWSLLALLESTPPDLTG